MSDPASTFALILFQAVLCSDGSSIDVSNTCKTGEKETIALSLVGGTGCDAIADREKCINNIDYIAQVKRNDVVIATIPASALNPFELQRIMKLMYTDVWNKAKKLVDEEKAGRK